MEDESAMPEESELKDQSEEGSAGHGEGAKKKKKRPKKLTLSKK